MAIFSIRNYCLRTWPVIKQLLADAWMPFSLITAYALYVSFRENNWSWLTFISGWSQAAIIVGTLANYYLRSKKQVQDGSRHGDVVRQLQGLVEKTERIIGWTTGGDGFSKLASITTFDNVIIAARFMIQGDYPLYELNVRVVDIDEFQSGIHKPVQSERELEAVMERGLKFTHKFNTALPSAYAYGLALNIPLREGRNHFHVQWSARNGMWYERLEVVATEHGWVSATSVSRGDQELFASREPGFPTNSDNTTRFSAPLPAAQQLSNLSQ